MKMCDFSGKFVNGKPVVLCEYAKSYVEKQGYKVISNTQYYTLTGDYNV